MPDPPVLRLDGVVVEHDGRRVLDGISADMTAGRVTVIAGPSGVGKTTLLRLCNRLDLPDEGRVLYGDKDVVALDPLQLRREVAMVFQRPVMLGGTVRDNLAVADAGQDAGYEAVLAEAELDASFLDRPADQLSGGEAQRVAVARALLTDPRVLLADEPTSGLDPTPRRAFERLARRLAHERGLAVVWVTHDLDQLRRLADHVIVLLGGRVAFAGAPDELDATHELTAFLTGGSDAG